MSEFDDKFGMDDVVHWVVVHSSQPVVGIEKNILILQDVEVSAMYFVWV